MRTLLLRYIEENREKLFSLLCGLIRINTENSGTHGNERVLAEYLAAEFARLGLASDVYSPDDVPGLTAHPDYLPGRNLADRTNITTKIAGSDSRRALMLAGHLDTVPIGTPELWSVPPTEGIIRDGRIYGRGANDDKYALAAFLFLAEAFGKLGVKLKNDLYLTGYVDEEFGGGNGALACCVKYPCDFYLNLDSDDFDIRNCGVGGQRLYLTLKNPEPKDSCALLIEGIYLAKKAIDRFGVRRKAELARNPFFKGTGIAESALRYMNIESGLNTNDRNVGILDFAFYTDRPQAQIRRELDEVFADITTAIAPLGLVLDKVTYRSRFFNYGFADSSHKNILLLQKSAKTAVGRDLRTCGMCLSDLSIFLHNTNGNAVSFGIGRDFGLYGGAHQPDEFVVCDDFVEFVKILAQFILDWDEADD